MDERKQISLIYQYNDKWIGGTYYILNIIKALAHLPENEQPFITIYHDESTSLVELQNIKYAGIKYVAFNYNISIIFKLINRIMRPVLGKSLFSVKLPGQQIINFYYRSFDIDNSNIEKYFCWIADLQALSLPEFFKKSEFKNQVALHRQMVKEREPIVFSSEAALNDFDRFYPKNKNEKRVLSFVSLPDPNLNALSISDLKAKFNITNDYFIVSNQFWKHKNHQLVLEAFDQILKKHPNIQLVLTGKEHDYRNPNYTNELKEFVAQNKLTDKILFLGFIDRDEQLELMSKSIAIIQPSLFEGWSTVVEDAKLLNKPIICSDILVHHEQLPDSDLFFNPRDKFSLIQTIERVLNKNYLYNVNYDHKKAVITFAKNFLQLFS